MSDRKAGWLMLLLFAWHFSMPVWAGFVHWPYPRVPLLIASLVIDIGLIVVLTRWAWRQPSAKHRPRTRS